MEEQEQVSKELPNSASSEECDICCLPCPQASVSSSLPCHTHTSPRTKRQRTGKHHAPTPPEDLLEYRICKKIYPAIEELAYHTLFCKPSYSSEDEEIGRLDAPYVPLDEEQEKMARGQEERLDSSEVETEEE